MEEVQNSVVVIGIGNSFRGDDAIGLIIIRHLKSLPSAGMRLEECEGEATRLLELWENASLAILIDAICSDRAPGTLQRFEATNQPLPAHLFNSTSTHSVDVAEAMELGRVLNCLPKRVIFYGIEGQQFEIGSSPLLEVEKASAAVLRQLEIDLSSSHP